jgi:nitrite reductase (NADH) large subunit
VVVAVGIRPNAEIAAAAGLAVKRGIIVDDGLSTSAAGVFAIGECAEHRGVCYGLVEPANEQAQVLAARLAGRDSRYRGSVNAANLKVSGIHVFSAGDFLGAPGTESIVLADPGRGTYRKLVVAGECLAGAVLYGDTTDAAWYLELIRAGSAIEAFREELIFGRALVERQAA